MLLSSLTRTKFSALAAHRLEARDRQPPVGGDVYAGSGRYSAKLALA